jgi:hypothetical protein
LPLAAPAPRRLDARQHDLIDVQEAVLLQADVDERGLQAGEDVVDRPCRCCRRSSARRGARGRAQRRDSRRAVDARAAASLGCAGRAGRFEQRNARLAASDAH